MDARNIGLTIAQLRKKNGMTQSALAEQLQISAKTVSRWESGLGYPEITQFPMLAKIFGVSIDYLMTGERKGIIFAGNILADVVKAVDCYPKIGMLANIKSVSRSVGGCVPNTAINLAKIDRSIPITAIGRVGDDEYGQYVISRMRQFGINTDRVCVSATQPTSFSDVISLPSGERTFFHARGANAEFCPEDVDVSTLNGSILHAGYILLLDSMDAEDAEYGTVMARFLHSVQERGIKTSVDVVSDSSADYHKMIVPALKYCNYAILNEIESTSIWGLSPRREDGKLHIDNLKETMRRMAECGVKDKIIVHSKEAGMCLDVASGEFTLVPSLDVPRSLFKGSVGAGDAFCSGCLYSLYNGLSDQEMLEFASAAAVCNLFAENAIDGMRSKNEIMKLLEEYGREVL